MNDRINEMMNKYLDGELKGKELQEFEEMLNSEEYKKTYNAYTMVDGLLKKVPSDRLPSNFTSSLMTRIQRNLKAKKEEKRFFFIVVTVFALTLLFLIGFVIAQSYSGPVPGNSLAAKEMMYYLKKGAEYISYLFPKQGISIVGGLISFGLLITAWLFFDFKGKKI